MAVRNPARRAIPVKPIKPPPEIKITERAHAPAILLDGAGARNADIPMTKAMLGPAFSELATKRVVKRSGVTKGRYGKPGFVRLAVAREQLVAVPNRAPRKPATAANPVDLDMPLAGSAALTIGELEAFVQRFREAQAPLLEERSRAIDARIAELQRYLAVAVGDDFRNTTAMANAAVRELDNVEHAVTAKSSRASNRLPDRRSSPVWRAMSER
jgi:hypothetical protein